MTSKSGYAIIVAKIRKREAFVCMFAPYSNIACDVIIVAKKLACEVHNFIKLSHFFELVVKKIW